MDTIKAKIDEIERIAREIQRELKIAEFYFTPCIHPDMNPADCGLHVVVQMWPLPKDVPADGKAPEHK